MGRSWPTRLRHHEASGLGRGASHHRRTVPGGEPAGGPRSDDVGYGLRHQGQERPESAVALAGSPRSGGPRGGASAPIPEPGFPRFPGHATRGPGGARGGLPGKRRPELGLRPRAYSAVERSWRGRGPGHPVEGRGAGGVALRRQCAPRLRRRRYPGATQRGEAGARHGAGGGILPGVRRPVLRRSPDAHRHRARSPAPEQTPRVRARPPLGPRVAGSAGTGGAGGAVGGRAAHDLRGRRPGG